MTPAERKSIPRPSEREPKHRNVVHLRLESANLRERGYVFIRLITPCSQLKWVFLMV
jgi:hypothetical protein